jgi:hypothetical protein
MISDEAIQAPHWDHTSHFFDGGEATVAYFLVLDSLNFCFWPHSGKPKWEIRHGPEILSGYYALSTSLKRAVESGAPIMDPGFLAELTLDQLIEILNGRGELQLLKARLNILNELGAVLLQEFDGKPHVFVEAAEGSALQLARLLAERLNSFRDVAEYGGEKIFFYKRAQILPADLYGAFNGKKWGTFRDIDDLTAFADYKLPQVLRHLDIFQYSEELGQRIDRMELIEAGSAEEVEIRGNTVWAVERIRMELEKLGNPLKASEIDQILWNMGQENAFRKRPYHRTTTIFY